MRDEIQAAIDELRAAFPPHPLDVQAAFDEWGVTCDGARFKAEAHGKRWDELSSRFLEYHHDALLFLGPSILVEVIPAYPSGLLKQIENVKEKIADLERARDELSSKISNAKDDDERRDLEGKKKATEDKIYDLEQKVSAWEKQLSDEKTEISNRIYNGERCVAHREAVTKALSDAKSSAKSESDAEIKPYAEKLIRCWESEEPGHEKAIRNYKDAVESCKKMQ